MPSHFIMLLSNPWSKMSVTLFPKNKYVLSVCCHLSDPPSNGLSICSKNGYLWILFLCTPPDYFDTSTLLNTEILHLLLVVTRMLKLQLQSWKMCFRLRLKMPPRPLKPQRLLWSAHAASMAGPHVYHSNPPMPAPNAHGMDGVLRTMQTRPTILQLLWPFLATPPPKLKMLSRRLRTPIS